MLIAGGYQIARIATIPWEDRMNVDGWPSRAGMYCNDVENSLCMRLIDYPVGSTEPRHVHAGMHATTVLKGAVLVDGITLGPMDVIVGPSNEPHGPLHYPQGCQLFSVFQGSYFHSEVEQLSGEKQYRLVRAEDIPWSKDEQGEQMKTLVDRGCGNVLLQAVRVDRGATLDKPHLLAALIVDGEVIIDGEQLGAWDFFYAREGVEHSPVECPSGATFLCVSLQ